MWDDRVRCAFKVSGRDAEEFPVSYEPSDTLCNGNYMVLTVHKGVIWSWLRLCVKSRKRGSLLWVLDKTKTAMGREPFGNM